MESREDGSVSKPCWPVGPDELKIMTFFFLLKTGTKKTLERKLEATS